MSQEELVATLPKIESWIQTLLSNHRNNGKAVSEYGFKRLGLYFNKSTLDEARAIPSNTMPFPPLSSWGIRDFEEMESLEADGVTYMDCFFIKEELISQESLFFHELVHVIQWRELGLSRFTAAYTFGHLKNNSYSMNPFETIAYELQQQFENGTITCNIESRVRDEARVTERRLMNGDR